MNLSITLLLLSNFEVFSFRSHTQFHTPFFNFKHKSHDDSVFRNPVPGEEIGLPKVNKPSGEYILDRPLIEKVASLRAFIETIEINRGKSPKDLCLKDSEGNDLFQEDSEDSQREQVEINLENLEPVRDLLSEEDLLEEVLYSAFNAYTSKNDQESVERLKIIANEMVPIATRLRIDKSEENICRLIACYTDQTEDLDKVLNELNQKNALDKYLLKRLDELISLASKKYRISEDHPSASEEFLKIVKDRIAAHRITYIRGTNSFVRTVSLCFESEEDDWDKIVEENIKSIEALEEFHQWLQEGIDYCRKTGKLKEKVDVMERLIPVVVRQHPIWTRKEDHIEYEGSVFRDLDKKMVF